MAKKSARASKEMIKKTKSEIRNTNSKDAKKPKPKTYNSWDSLVVTDPTTNQPVHSLSWQSGRDAEFSVSYGRMYQKCPLLHL